MKDFTPNPVNRIQIAGWLFVTLLLFTLLQTQYNFYFYYIEQFQLFPFTFDFFLKEILQPGGFISYMEGFLKQFYILPFCGSLSTTFFLLLGCLLTQSILKKLFLVTSPFIAAIPMCIQLMLSLNTNYYLQGLLAFLCMLGCFSLFLSITRPVFRLVAALVLPFFLFWIAGAVMTLLVVGILLWLLFQKPSSAYWCAGSLLVGILIISLAIHTSWQSSVQMFVTPFLYSYPEGEIPYLNWSWYLFPITLLLARLLKGKMPASRRAISSMLILQFLVIGIAFWGICRKVQKTDPVLFANMEQDYYLRNRQWNAIISSFSSQAYNTQTLNILNLALSRTHQLDERLFRYPQRGGETLIAAWDEQLPNALAQADLHYLLGNIGLAQKYAYEGYIISYSGNPRLLKCLIETNLIFGYYPVAEKYMDILGQTLFYKDWVNAHRPYLYNDSLLVANAEYGAKRKALSNHQEQVVSLDFIRSLEYLAVNNPSEPEPMHYLTLYHMLNKDLYAFEALYNQYYHTKTWPDLTTRQQEAVIVWNEDKPELWIEKGISLKTEQRFLDYKDQMLHSGPYTDPRKQLAASFGDTYWYYLFFNE